MNKSNRQTRTGGRAATLGVIKGRYALAVGNPNTLTPTGWKWTRLTDIARLETGHTPSRKKPAYWGGDVPWVGIRDATNNHGRTIFETNENTNDLGIENSSARVLPENTVCLSRTASVGYVVVMGKPMATSQDFVNWVCSEKLDHRFLKYVLLSERDSFARFAHGTTHQTIYFPEVKAFHVCLPPIEEQRRIADVLTSIDDKIELNRRMNQTLGAIARALFKSWFVDFDPVRAKAEGRDTGLPKHIADLFPDRFVDSELGEIPEGWDVEPLDKIANFLNGLAMQKFPPVDGEKTLPVIKIAQLKKGDTNSADIASSNLDPKYIVNDGDLIFSWSGSLEVKVWSGGQGALNQHLFKVTSEEYSRWFCHFLIQKHLENFRRIATDKAVTIGHIKRSHLSAALCAVPPNGLLQRAADIFHSLEQQSLELSLQSRNLAEVRDHLLPKLISGEKFATEVA